MTQGLEDLLNVDPKLKVEIKEEPNDEEENFEMPKRHRRFSTKKTKIERNKIKRYTYTYTLSLPQSNYESSLFSVLI